MRLTSTQYHAIKKYFHDVFGEGEIYLFGSRVDENRRGGDIDLYVRTPNLQNLMRKKVDFLSKLKHDIGEQKIDVVFDRHKHRAIDKIVLSTGVKL